jgi:hypothetical protein
MQSGEEEETDRAFQDLRVGYILSIISIVCFTTSILTSFAGWILTAVFYFLAVWKRASGWSLLDFEMTRYAMLGCAAFNVAYPILLLLSSLLGFWSLALYLATYALFFVPVALWVFYTCVENNNLRIIEKELGINLRLGRICALVGIVIVGVGYFGFVYPIYPITLLLLPYFSAFFASPFLIASCILIIRKLKVNVKLNRKKT